MEEKNIEMMQREKGPDSILNHLRKNGFIPGVIYGNNNESQLIKVDQKKLNRQLKRNGKSSIFHAEFADELVPVKINEIQRDPVNREVVHVDFQRIEMDKQIEVAVPLYFNTEPIGVKRGGSVQQQLREIKLRALPSEIPDYIKVDISDLDIGDVMRIRDLSLPDNVEIQHDAETVLLTILPPKMEQDEKEEFPDSEPEIIDARDGKGIDADK